MIGVAEVKTALRINHERLDGEVQDTITAAYLDLDTAGVQGTYDALVDMAVKLYARWQFDFCGKGESYRQAYEDLKSCLALVRGYREEGNS